MRFVRYAGQQVEEALRQETGGKMEPIQSGVAWDSVGLEDSDDLDNLAGKRVEGVKPNSGAVILTFRRSLIRDLDEAARSSASFRCRCVGEARTDVELERMVE